MCTSSRVAVPSAARRLSRQDIRYVLSNPQSLSSLILFIAVALGNDLPTNRGQQYSMLLGRKYERDFLPRAVVPPRLLIQTPGENIETVMPTSWWLAVSTVPMLPGQEVQHSRLPANQVPIEIGQSAVVTGSRRSGFNITVSWPS